MRPLCNICGESPVRKKGLKCDGSVQWDYRCGPCERIKKRVGFYIKKTCCAECGFLPGHPCQLDIDHIDGNSKNNDPGNLQVLCANCHRLKTYMNKDWE